MKPAADVDNLFRFLEHIIITFHHVISTAADFSNSVWGYWLISIRVYHPNLYSRERLANSFDPEFYRIIHSCLSHAWGSFRKPVNTGNLIAVHIFYDLFHSFHRTGRTSHDPCPQGRKVEHIEH